MTVLQVLVDADNVEPARLQPVLDLLAECAADVDLIASGRQQAIDLLRWPDNATVLVHAGWQRADIALADAYVPNRDPLLLVTGDGDFGLLAARHAGPVLVISGAPSARLRDAATVVDPAVEGTDPIKTWISAITGDRPE